MFSACGSGPLFISAGLKPAGKACRSREAFMIKAVIFDIDNTLYSYDEANACAFAELLRYAERELGIPEAEFREEYSREYAAMRGILGETAAIHNRLIRIQRVLEKRGLPLTPHVLRMNDLYWDCLMDAMKPSPHAEETLRALRQAGIRTGCGTDMTARVQFQKLERLGMLDAFDFLVSSEEAGVEKPASGMFLLCAGKAGVLPEECLFVGDNRKKDVQGALDAGMHAAWFCPEKEAGSPGFPADGGIKEGAPVIRDLSEILRLLRETD